MMIIKTAQIPRKYWSGDGGDNYPIKSVVLFDTRRTTVSAVHSHLGAATVSMNDTNIIWNKDLDACFGESVDSELLEYVKQLPNLTSILGDYRVDLNIINNGKTAEQVAIAYSMQRMIDMLTRYELIYQHIEPIINMLQSTTKVGAVAESVPEVKAPVKKPVASRRGPSVVLNEKLETAMDKKLEKVMRNFDDLYVASRLSNGAISEHDNSPVLTSTDFSQPVGQYIWAIDGMRRNPNIPDNCVPAEVAPRFIEEDEDEIGL